jgi:hypothetical protein
MANADNQYDLPRILQFANDAEIAYAIAPQSEFVVSERLAKTARIVRLSDSLLHIPEYL